MPDLVNKVIELFLNSYQAGRYTLAPGPSLGREEAVLLVEAVLVSVEVSSKIFMALTP